MKHKTRVLALFLALCLLVSLFPAAFAEGGDDISELTEDTVFEQEPVEEEPAEEPTSAEEEEPEESAASEYEEEAEAELEEVSFSEIVPLALAHSGSCGASAIWRLDDNGLLTVSGTGNMTNYTDSNPAPWANFDVLNAVIESGVESIGDNAFFCAGSKLKSVTIADTVDVIGENAFKDCEALTEVSFNGKVPYFSPSAAAVFSGVTATAYYLFEEDSWTAAVREGFGEKFTWKAFDSLGNVFFAAGNCSTGLRWALSSEGVLTIAGNGTMDDNPWKALSSSVRSVVIEAGVQSIASSAFDSFSGMTSVAIPDSVTSIGDNAFAGCSALESVTIPDTVTSIGDYAFSGCSALESVTIPENVTSVGKYAFRNCTALAKITFKGDAPVIGTNAFYYVKASVYYLASKTGWTDSVRVDYGGTVKWVAYDSCGDDLIWTLDGEGLLTISGTGAMKPFANYNSAPWYTYRESIINVVIEVGATSVSDYAFYKCVNLTSASIPEGVTGIGKNAFSYCSKLTSITLPEGVTGISDYTFRDCSLLANVSIPATVTSIGNYAFSGCSGLVSITIPEAVTGIGNFAFSGCSSLTSITIPETVTSIGSYAFSSCGALTSVSIPETVTAISDGSFQGCSSLTSITIPEAVTSIGNYAFSGCSGLTSVVIPDSVTSIGKNAFKNCTALAKLSFKGAAPTIGDNAFSAVKAYAYYPAGEGSWTTSVCVNYGGTITWVACSSCGDELIWTLDENGVLSISGTGAMYAYGKDSDQAPWYSSRNSILKVNIGEQVTSIGAWAFYNCIKLESINIPDSVTSIGTGAFCNCKKLQSVDIPYGVTSIEDNTFEGCSALTSIVLPYKLTSIGDSAFARCGVSGDIYLPATVTSIGSAAFSSCENLKNITAAPSNKNYSSLDGVLFNKDKTVLLFYPAGKTAAEYTVPSSVKSIGDYAFSGCKKLTGVTVPKGVTSIGEYGFSESGITGLKIPEGITSISNNTFYKCEALVSVTIPKGVTSIGEAAFGKSGLFSLVIPEGIKSLSDNTFYECKSLESVTIPKGVTSIGKSCFGGCSDLQSVNIPKGVTSIGESCFDGCTRLTGVTIPESVTSLGSKALANIGNPSSEIIFKGSAPTFGANVFFLTKATVYYPGSDSSWTPVVLYQYGGTIEWKKASCYIKFNSSDIPAGSSVWVDGIEYKYTALTSDGTMLSLKVDDENAKAVTIYTYNDGGTPNEKYPTGMKVWLLSHDGKVYTAKYVADFDNILGYAGCSIRISGTKGIRMITSVNKALKDKLIGDGVEGCKLQEYGTLLAWANTVPSSELVLGVSGVSSNYAYKRGVADPVFAYSGANIQYTNVITGFSNKQCKPDLVMRPYMKLSDGDGNVITIYGGVVQRSIGYIAYQNRAAFKSGTSAYEYVWDIIHYVYGTKYDADYYGG